MTQDDSDETIAARVVSLCTTRRLTGVTSSGIIVGLPTYVVAPPRTCDSGISESVFRKRNGFKLAPQSSVPQRVRTPPQVEVFSYHGAAAPDKDSSVPRLSHGSNQNRPLQTTKNPPAVRAGFL